MTSYTGIGCTHIFGAILLFYRHPAGEYRESRNEYCYTLSIGLLILVVDKRQDRHINEIIDTQHKTTHEIHKMIQEQMSIIKETHKGSSDHNKAWVI